MIDSKILSKWNCRKLAMCEVFLILLVSSSFWKSNEISKIPSCFAFTTRNPTITIRPTFIQKDERRRKIRKWHDFLKTKCNDYKQEPFWGKRLTHLCMSNSSPDNHNNNTISVKQSSNDIIHQQKENEALNDHVDHLEIDDKLKEQQAREEAALQQHLKSLEEKYKNARIGPYDVDPNTVNQQFYPPPKRDENEDLSAIIDAQAMKRLRLKRKQTPVQEQPLKPVPESGFNIVLTHCTADFDSLASAVGLAKLWSNNHHHHQDDQEPTIQQSENDQNSTIQEQDDGFHSRRGLPTFVVLPRGAHPGVERFLALHKYLFPIRSLRSLPSDLSGLYRLGLVDAQRRNRVGPAEHLISAAKRVTIVDHHIDTETDIPEATDYVVDQVGSVSTLICEQLMQQQQEQDVDDLTEAEATLLALGIHTDTGSLCFDSTTPRDAKALAWLLEKGASQTAIAEHAKPLMSREQQAVLTQALIHCNSTQLHGVTVSTVLLQTDAFINGLASVAQDAMELSSSDVFLLGLLHESGRRKRKSAGKADKKKKKKKKDKKNKNKNNDLGENTTATTTKTTTTPIPAKKKKPLTSPGLSSRILQGTLSLSTPTTSQNTTDDNMNNTIAQKEEEQDGEHDENNKEELINNDEENRIQRLRTAFDRRDMDGSGYLERKEIAAALSLSGIILSDHDADSLMEAIDTDGDGKIDFDEFVSFCQNAERLLQQEEQQQEQQNKTWTLIVIGRAKAGVNTKAVKLNRLLERLGGGGHAKAASATVRLSGNHQEQQAEDVLQCLVDELLETSLTQQLTVGDFMTSPVKSATPDMTEDEVERLFGFYDVRALPVVDDENNVVGLVTYKEVAAAKQRLIIREQNRLRHEAKSKQESNGNDAKTKKPYYHPGEGKQQGIRKNALKGWMLQHVTTIPASTTMSEAENLLLVNDVGCIPVVADGTNQLVGMVTRTDLLRQHHYYPSLQYHNKGFASNLEDRKQFASLWRTLKRYDPL